MKNNLQQIVVLGGGYAGVMAAVRLARQTKNLDVKIILVDASDGMVERIRLHQLAAGQQVNKIPYQKLIKNTKIEFLQAYVTAINPTEKKIILKQNQKSIELDYHRLIYALGSSVDLDSVSGARENTYSLGSHQTSLLLKEQLTKNPNGNLLICGGGLTGIESATELAETYPNLKVTLVTSGSFASDFSQKGQKYLQKFFSKHNILVKDNSRIAKVEAKAALLKDGSKIDFDFCLWAGALIPPKIARQAGIEVNEVGQIIVDKALRSISHKEIYGAGDAAILEPSAEIYLRMSCASAMPMGAHTADNILAELKNTKLKNFRFGYGGRCVSLGRKDAIIQIAEHNDSPKENIITGSLGIFVKEIICRYTIWSLHLERSGWLTYRWPQPFKQEALRVASQHSTGTF